MKPRRSWFYISCGLVAVAAIAILVRKGYSVAHATAGLLAVPATVSDVELSVIATGTLEPERVVNLGAQVSGQLKSLKVRLGDRVKLEQLIAEIDPALATNTLRSSRATLASLRAQRRSAEISLKLAEREFQRATELLQRALISRESYETTRTTMEADRAQVDSLDAQIGGAEISVDTAEVNVGYTRITAPIDGTVVGIVTKQGQTVNAAQTAPTIVMLANLDRMVVSAKISEADALKVSPGQSLYFTTLGDSERRYGTLQTIDPVPESFVDDAIGKAGPAKGPVYFLARFEVDNRDGRLRTGMTVQVHIVLAEAKGVITIPSVALQQQTSPERYMVQVITEAGQLELRNVQVRLNNHVQAQIVDGLKTGERVVIVSSGASGQ
jgi:macrolide-specific efflux system membrane fusion protein